MQAVAEMKKAAALASEAAYSKYQTGAFDMPKNSEPNNKSQWPTLRHGRGITFAELIDEAHRNAALLLGFLVLANTLGGRDE
ncbi:hypothetical protein [Zobellella sp. DQSA1]|uniref:hypothetical protein n=1 Tax=Zobellella sp. DQSA1 TaxID=3342386 RepID=UPI0035C1B4BA